jgi:uridine monophosphate synthetase
MIEDNIKKELILDLYKIEAIKFGKFKLKSGTISPIYIDLRLSISYPKVLGKIAEAIWEKIKDLQFDLICGVPFSAIPFATVIAVNQKVPMIMCRKKSKEHGTKKNIEGHFKPGDYCVLIEDLITSGSSILETIESLKGEGLVVKDVAVLIDREQNGKVLLENKGYNVHAAFTLDEVLETLQNENKIDSATIIQIKEFIQANQF